MSESQGIHEFQSRGIVLDCQFKVLECVSAFCLLNGPIDCDFGQRDRFHRCGHDFPVMVTERQQQHPIGQMYSAMSRNTLDCADSSHAVHVTSRTRHRLPMSSGHLGPVPRAWNLSPQFVSLFGPLPCICFLSHLCLYEAYLFMIRFLLCPHVSPRPSVSASHI